ncbi:unnamed protein product [Calypogeia fissa]
MRYVPMNVFGSRSFTIWITSSLFANDHPATWHLPARGMPMLQTTETALMGCIYRLILTSRCFIVWS